MPKKYPSFQSKPWWTDQLSSLRRAFHSASRRSRKLPTTSHLNNTKDLKNKYFHAIKQAKASYWKQFLTTVDPRSIWTAKKLAVGRPPDRFPSIPDATTPLEINDALLLHFFPPMDSPTSLSILRPFKHVPPLEKEEVQRALSKSFNSSAPGPDQISYGVWKRVHSINPVIPISLLNSLILYGFHPLSLKKANGVVLSKPGKPDYSSPSSFRIIVLLKTVSKILEHIIANRLSLLARLVGLIHPNQCGSLPGLSTFDACASLSHEVRALQRANCKASTLFLDIKGGFDNVSSSHLSSILRQKVVSAYLVAWIRSFLTNRQCRLIFQGAPNIFSPVSVGTPQGSPISPLLFVIYVSSLHLSIPKGIIFSYIDDFTVTVGSLSYRRDTQRLHHYYSTLKRRANLLGVSFSIPKTELCHWRMTRNRAPISSAPVCLNNSLFHPSSLVHWLGYWFTPSMDTTPHFTQRQALAQGAFATVKQLFSLGSDLPPTSIDTLRWASFSLFSHM